MTPIPPRPITSQEDLFQYIQDAESEYKKELAFQDIVDHISGRRSSLN